MTCASMILKTPCPEVPRDQKLHPPNRCRRPFRPRGIKDGAQLAQLPVDSSGSRRPPKPVPKPARCKGKDRWVRIYDSNERSRQTLRFPRSPRRDRVVLGMPTPRYASTTAVSQS